MRRFLRRYGLGTVLLAAGILMLTATGFSLALVEEPAQVETTRVAEQRAKSEGLAAGIALKLGLLGHEAEAPALRVEPEAAEALPLPGFTLRRDVAVDEAGLNLEAGVDLAMGSHRSLDHDSTVETQGATVRQEALPAPAAVALAAAAFTGAGFLAYFWANVKTWLLRVAWFPLVPLYAKISRAEVFDNGVRERIFHLIKQTPGIAASDLAREAAVSWGTTIYHLDVLEQTRMVTSLREGRYRRYFENGAALPEGGKQAIAVLHNATTAGVADTIRASPGATQKELAAATGMSPQALHWHIQRLAKAGLVRKQREGRVVRHYVG